MSAVAIPAQSTRGDASAPQLRTILLTDLCDSTQLVERLGDSAAADLFRQHDLLVLQLQQQWRGRLIDRSDGMLLLFERPIDGLGFVLDYHRGLRELGSEHDVDLKARAGLHVGEVLTWRNSEEAVKVGAKPLEVEGLAKPMAARLMTMARPGQVLVSAVAEPLAHRSARELGERGQQLLWKSHGRWRFKGLPNPQEIFEVGEAGLAPLRAPKASPKAWRDIPLWRRPAALAAEFAVVLGVGLGIWFVTKPQPAIAFNERDWVVVADLRNLTGQPVLDDSLEQAFRISLGQSRYVNVLSDLKARQTLERMRLPPETELTRSIASEIAIRDGARAVILPTVVEVGGHVRVSAEVIDPHSQTTVYSEYADGRGAESALSSIDDVTVGLREQLGEALQSVERDSQPLPKVTTKNLDALRAYALAVESLNESRYSKALGLFKHALELDPEFALADIGAARAYLAADEPDNARPHILGAMANADRLTDRDKVYAEAWAATLGPVRPMLEKWRLMSEMYPDYYASFMNYSLWSWLYANQYSVGIPGLKYAASSLQNPHRGVYSATLAMIHIGLEDYESAQESIRLAQSSGAPISVLPESTLLAVQRAFSEAARVAASKRGSGAPTADSLSQVFSTTLEVDAGDFSEAYILNKEARNAADEGEGAIQLLHEIIALELDVLNGANIESRSTGCVNKAKNFAESASGLAKTHALFSAMACGYMGARANSVQALDLALVGIDGDVKKLGYPYLSQMHHLLEAERLRLKGKHTEAQRLLESKLGQGELYQTHVSLMELYQATGNYEEALSQAEWLISHRGRAYVEWGSYRLLQPLNVADSNMALLAAAEIEKKMGRNEAAQRHREKFLSRWPRDNLPDHLRRRVDALL